MISQLAVKPEGTSLHFENGRLGAISDRTIGTAWTFPQMKEILPGNHSQLDFAKRSVKATGSLLKTAKLARSDAVAAYRNLYQKQNPSHLFSFIYRYFPRAIPRNSICGALAMGLAGFGAGYAYAKR